MRHDCSRHQCGRLHASKLSSTFACSVPESRMRASLCIKLHVHPNHDSLQADAVRFSIFQHLARVRRVYNLFEDDDVVGITNYLDFGIAVEAPMGAAVGEAAAGQRDERADALRFESAASWQVRICPRRFAQ